MTEAEYNRVSNLAILRIAKSVLKEVWFYKQPHRDEKRNRALIAVGELIDELYAELDTKEEDTP